MGEVTKIEWTDHTFNGWIGKRTSVANWRKPLQWDKAAARDGVRRKVFCNSLADVFDAEVSDDWRIALMHLIIETPHLDWLLLTKRPQVAVKFSRHFGPLPVNVWLGTTVENQAMADLRIPTLLSIKVSKRFLSCEPLLGPVDVIGTLARWQDATRWSDRAHIHLGEQLIPWIICGGESGWDARPMHPEWARSLRDQCQAAGLAFHFNQWGEWLPCTMENPSDGSGWLIYPEDESIDLGDRKFKTMTAHGKEFFRYGKVAAGAMLDGREWREMPA